MKSFSEILYTYMIGHFDAKMKTLGINRKVADVFLEKNHIAVIFKRDTPKDKIDQLIQDYAGKATKMTYDGHTQVIYNIHP